MAPSWVTDNLAGRAAAVHFWRWTPVPPPTRFPSNVPAMLTIGIVLLVIWFLGFMIMRKVLGALIHLVLIVAIALLVWHYVGPMLR